MDWSDIWVEYLYLRDGDDGDNDEDDNDED